MPDLLRLRWIAVCVFVLSSTLNYLDRQLLAFFAPAIAATFHFSMQRFGFLVACFSVAYAASALVTGWLLDRLGVNRAIGAAVAWWSAASIASAAAPSFGFLAVSRAALGVGESAGVPAVGKLNSLYLKPEERAMGAAVNQIGLALGAMLAPLWIALPPGLTWRTAFFVSGALGIVWIPLWMLVSRRIPAQYAATEFVPNDRARFSLLRDRNLIFLVLVNVFWMATYSLWSNWTTVYLVKAQHLTLHEAAHYVWIPPMIANLGGFFGGWLSMQWIRKGSGLVRGRQLAIWISAVGALFTLLLPATATPIAATAVMSASFFFVLAGSVNIYALPIDLYGAHRSGLAIAALTCAFGIMQAVISPVIGYLTDHTMYTAMVWICTAPLFVAAALLTQLRVSTSE